MSAEKKKIEIIQALRGIAALGIVYFHTEYGPRDSANWGVDFFFILSGYFLMMNTETKRGGIQYWKNKLIKLCPLYYTMTIITALGYTLVPSVFRSTMVNAETLAKSFLFIPCLAREGRIYPIYSVAWTLNLEMFFYLLFFVSMRISHRYRGSIAAGASCLLILFGWLLQPQNVIIKFWTQMRLLDFVAGIGIYCLEQKAMKISIKKEICEVGIGATILLLFSGRYLLGDHFSFLWNLLGGGGNAPSVSAA